MTDGALMLLLAALCGGVLSHVMWRRTRPPLRHRVALAFVGFWVGIIGIVGADLILNLAGHKNLIPQAVRGAFAAVGVSF